MDHAVTLLFDDHLFRRIQREARLRSVYGLESANRDLVICDALRFGLTEIERNRAAVDKGRRTLNRDQNNRRKLKP